MSRWMYEEEVVAESDDGMMNWLYWSWVQWLEGGTGWEAAVGAWVDRACDAWIDAGTTASQLLREHYGRTSVEDLVRDLTWAFAHDGRHGALATIRRRGCPGIEEARP